MSGKEHQRCIGAGNPTGKATNGLVQLALVEVGRFRHCEAQLAQGCTQVPGIVGGVLECGGVAVAAHADHKCEATAFLGGEAWRG